MKCINKSHPEFKRINDVFKDDTLTNHIISTWQNINKTEEFPTTTEAISILNGIKKSSAYKNNTFVKGILTKLRSLGLLDGFKKGSMFRLNAYEPDSLRRVSDSIINYFNFLDVDDTIYELYAGSQEGFLEIKKDVLSISNLNNNKATNDSLKTAYIIDKLVELFPQVNVELLSVSEANAIYKSLPKEEKANVPFSSVKSFYYKGTAILIKDRVDSSTAIEEVLHPFIDVLYQDNKSLFNALLKEAKENYTDIVDHVRNNYTEERGFAEKDREIEIATKALTSIVDKELSSKPKSLWSKIKEWFSSLITRVGRTIVSDYKIDARDLSSLNTLTDVAKLLSSGKLTFDPEAVGKSKVRFALSDYYQKGLEHLLAQANGNKAQTEFLLKAFQLVQQSPDVNAEQFGINKLDAADKFVLIDEATHTYYDVKNTAKVYHSSTTSFKGKSQISDANRTAVDIGNDFDTIFEAVALGKSFDEIQKMVFNSLNKDQLTEVYDTAVEVINEIKSRHNGAIVIPQVVVYYESNSHNIAGMIDLLAIAPDGTFTVYDLKTSKHSVNDVSYGSEDIGYNNVTDSLLLTRLAQTQGQTSKLNLSKKTQHSLQVNMYSRMLELLGYKKSDKNPATYHVQINYDSDNKYKSHETEGFNEHLSSENELYIDLLLPNPSEQGQIESGKKTREEIRSMLNDADSQFTVAEAYPNLDTEVAQSIIALNQYRNLIYNAKNVIAEVKKGILFEKNYSDEIKRLDFLNAVAELGASKGGAVAIRSIGEILIEAKKEITKYKNYISDPRNFSDPEFPSKLSAFDAYKKRFSPILSDNLLDQSGEVRKNLIISINKMLSELSAGPEVPGSVQYALTKYLSGQVKDRDSRNLTESEALELIESAEDISTGELLFGNRAFSKDVLVSLGDRIYKEARHKSINLAQRIVSELQDSTNKLMQAAGTKNPKDLYMFMIEESEEDGAPKKIIEEIGTKYYDIRDKLLSDINGEEYIEVDPKNPDPELVAYNLELRKKKRAYSKFMQAERVNDLGELTSGEYHEYDIEYIRARDRHMNYITTKKGESFWVYKPGLSAADKMRFENKYYRTIPNYKTCDDKGNIVEKDLKVVKDQYVLKIKRPDMLSEKYAKMIRDAHPSNQGNAGYELAKARLEYYETYQNLFAQAIDMIGEENTNKLMGQMINVRANLTKDLLNRPPFFTKMMSKVRDLVPGLVEMFSDRIEFSRNLEDEAGETRYTIPKMYISKPKDEAYIKKLREKQKESKARIVKFEREIDLIKAGIKRNTAEGKSTLSLERKDQRLTKLLKTEKLLNKDISQKLYVADRAIERKDLSINLSDSLSKFLSMAINYRYMSDIEDTLLVIQDKIASRNTTSSFENLETPRRSLSGALFPKFKEKGQTNLDLQYKTFLKNNLYGLDLSKKTWMYRFLTTMKTLGSLRVMALNPFTSSDNLIYGLVEDSIEAGAGKHITRKSLTRAYKQLTKSMAEVAIQRSRQASERILGKDFQSRPLTKEEALIEMYKMLDQKSDLREISNTFNELGSGYSNFGKDKVLNFLYSLQDGGEYIIQASIGIGMLMDTTVMNEETGETLSLYDAYSFNVRTGELTLDPKYKLVEVQTDYVPDANILKDRLARKAGLANKKIIVKGDVDEQFILDKRYAIRNLNIMIHGSYALEDKTFAENTLMGILLLNFHKWVWEAGIQKYFGKRRYHATLGYTEGRYTTLFSYFGYLAKKMANIKGADNDGVDLSSFLTYSGYTGNGGRKDDEAMAIVKNLHRAQITVTTQVILGLVRYLGNRLKDAILNEEEDELEDWEKRLLNSFYYRIDKLYKEQTTFSFRLFEGVYQLFKSPFAVSSVFGETSEFITQLMKSTYYGGLYAAGVTSEDEYLDNKDVFYQRGIRSGEYKLTKEASDLIPVVHAWNKWINYVNQDEFFVPL